MGKKWSKALRRPGTGASFLGLPTLVERLERRTLLSGAAPVTTGADFFGQLGGWISVSPSGDASGNTDTANIQTALNEVGTPGFSSTVYLNTGTYHINQSLVLRGKYESNIIGTTPPPRSSNGPGRPRTLPGRRC